MCEFTIGRKEKKELKRESRECTSIKRQRAAYKRIMQKERKLRHSCPDLKRAFHALQ